MGLNKWAQETVDKQIDQLWTAYKAGYEAGKEGNRFPGAVGINEKIAGFEKHMLRNEPTLADYVDEAKLV